MKKKVLKYPTILVSLVKTIEFYVVSLKTLEKGLYTFQLLSIYDWWNKFHASIKQYIRLPKLLVGAIGIHKFIFGTRFVFLTRFFVNDRCSHALPQNTDEDIGFARFPHIIIYCRLYFPAYFRRNDLFPHQGFQKIAVSNGVHFIQALNDT